ncbi:ATP-binding cassette domain-containing protein [Paenibacillus sp. F411]|uniref:ABC transporter ATP-binding protein n=1 Tax=Paenibacillus sp. F411 TaxID=2820239 RepID=UPI001AAE30F8|nr:ATP-binding cassette domain-containing protein [Paenibacillus sp. F411]MBO2942909.1 ATP-binding cassette domain-containing protein [Paenibacillus sp. F411]
MISIRNLNKSFGGKTLFSNFNMEIQAQDFMIISGPSGCGKTTLLNMIGAIESVESGIIEVDGVDISKKNNQLHYFRTKVGFLFQNFALVDHKTVRDNLLMIRKNSRSNLSIEEALQKVGLEDKLNSKVYTLSGGEQQRVALARLMLKKCDVILADEPTGSLDHNNAKTVLAILKEFNQQGKTIVLVTHDEKIIHQGNKVVSLSENK